MRRPFLLGIMLVGGAVRLASADPTWKLDANDSTYSYVCDGGDSIAINGNGNTLTITGECTVVDVAGSHNNVSIVSVGTIKVNGNNNDIRYTRAPEHKPKPVIKNKGVANTIRRSS